MNASGVSVGAPDAPPWYAAATPIPRPPPPAAPTNLRIERVCDHRMKVRWHRSAGATGYDLEIGSANGKHWKRLLTNWPGNPWYATHWDKNRTYRFAVRAVNDGGASAWVNSAASVAPPCAVNNLSVVTSTPGEGDTGAAGGEISASWSVASRGASDTVSAQSPNGGMTSQWSNANVAWLTASNIKGTAATLNLADHSGQWWYNADTGPDSACQGPVAAGTSSDNLTGLTEHQQYTYTAYDAAGCNSGDALDSITFTFEPSGDVLKAESITATTATLKLENHTGDWWYKRTAPDAGNCTKGEADFTNDLDSLAPGTAGLVQSPFHPLLVSLSNHPLIARGILRQAQDEREKGYAVTLHKPCRHRVHLQVL